MKGPGLYRWGLALLLAALAAEVALRLWSHTDNPVAWKLLQWDPDATQLDLLGAHCYRLRPHTVVKYRNGSVARVNGMGFRGPEVAIPKPPGVFRVVLLGGSTSHGFAVRDDETIDAHLRRSLERTAPGRRVEVVNLGVDALDAPCDLERLRAEGLALEPDAVIVHDGINDVPALRFGALAPDAPERGIRVELRRGAEARLRETGLWRAIKHRSFLARLPGVVKHLLRRVEPVDGPAEPAPGGLDAFAATIREMADLVPATTAVLLSSPPSALAHDAPSVTAGVVDAATTQRYRDALDARMRAVAAELAAGGRRVTYVQHDVPPDSFLDDCHLTSDGNRKVADDFARFLAPLVGR